MKPKAQKSKRRVGSHLPLKQHLQEQGLTYRVAAPLLGCTYQHLSEVLNGHRTSRRLLAKVANLQVAA